MRIVFQEYTPYCICMHLTHWLKLQQNYRRDALHEIFYSAKTLNKKNAVDLQLLSEILYVCGENELYNEQKKNSIDENWDDRDTAA